MIPMWLAILCGAVLIVAGVMEVMANNDRRHLMRLTGLLCSFGFVLLGVRYLYLVYVDDIARLNVFGTAAIVAIALGRIISCADVIRQ